jgi:malonyl-CoA O-methyltransferase
MTQPEQSEIAAAYNDWAETYDLQPNRTRDLAATALRHANLELNARKVIELGCGTGRNTEWLADRAAALVAVDFSEAMLDRARAGVKDSRVRFVRHDIRTPWPFPNASADVIVAMLILEHVEHLETIFSEVARVLDDNGQFLLCELHPIRQLAGGQARFTNSRTGENQCIAAFLHDVSDYVNTGLGCGFQLQHMGEWRDDGATPTSDPRVLSLLFRFQPGH